MKQSFSIYFVRSFLFFHSFFGRLLLVFEKDTAIFFLWDGRAFVHLINSVFFLSISILFKRDMILYYTQKNIVFQWSILEKSVLKNSGLSMILVLITNNIFRDYWYKSKRDSTIEKHYNYFTNWLKVSPNYHDWLRSLY